MTQTPKNSKFTVGKVRPLTQILFFLLIVLTITVSDARSSGPAHPWEGMGPNREAMPMAPPMPPPLLLPGSPEMAGPAMEPPPFFFDLVELGLDEKQQESVREITVRVRKDDVRKNAEITVARMELGELAHKRPLDMGAIEAKLRQISTLDLSIKFSHFKAAAEIESKLTPDQRNKLASMRQPPMGMKRSHGCSEREKPGAGPSDGKQ
jgi:hypothetical protein